MSGPNNHDSQRRDMIFRIFSAWIQEIGQQFSDFESIALSHYTDNMEKMAKLHWRKPKHPVDCPKL